jgi:hypothetical protein
MARRTSRCEVSAARAVLGFLKSDPKKPEHVPKTGPFSRKTTTQHNVSTANVVLCCCFCKVLIAELCCCFCKVLIFCILLASQRGVFFSFPMWCICGLPKSGAQWHKKHESSKHEISFLAVEMARSRCRCFTELPDPHRVFHSRTSSKFCGFNGTSAQRIPAQTMRAVSALSVTQNIIFYCRARLYVLFGVLQCARCVGGVLAILCLAEYLFGVLREWCDGESVPTVVL